MRSCTLGLPGGGERLGILLWLSVLLWGGLSFGGFGAGERGGGFAGGTKCSGAKGGWGRRGLLGGLGRGARGGRGRIEGRYQGCRGGSKCIGPLVKAPRSCWTAMSKANREKG